MCGRFVRTGSVEVIKQTFGTTGGEDNWIASFNVAPGSPTPIIRKSRSLDVALWDLKPSWKRSSESIAPLFNARAETIHQLPSFSEAFQKRRCLVPASGFYEWRKDYRQPFYFQRHDNSPMAFAGIWEEGEQLSTCIITTTPNHEMADIHHRMPVILEANAWEEWLLSGELSKDQQGRLLSTSPDNTLARWPVGHRVGNFRNDDSRLLERVREAEFTPELF